MERRLANLHVSSRMGGGGWLTCEGGSMHAKRLNSW